jgi:hypothetical protein
MARLRVRRFSTSTCTCSLATWGIYSASTPGSGERPPRRELDEIAARVRAVL